MKKEDLAKIYISFLKQGNRQEERIKEDLLEISKLKNNKNYNYDIKEKKDIEDAIYISKYIYYFNRIKKHFIVYEDKKDKFKW